MIEETTASSGKRRLFIETAGLSLPANQTKANTLVASNFLYPYSFSSSDFHFFLEFALSPISRLPKRNVFRDYRLTTSLTITVQTSLLKSYNAEEIFRRKRRFTKNFCSAGEAKFDFIVSTWDMLAGKLGSRLRQVKQQWLTR